jgi:hypothetical protein
MAVDSHHSEAQYTVVSREERSWRRDSGDAAVFGDGGSSSTLPKTKSEEELFAEAIMALDANNGALFDSVQAALATGSSDLEIERHLLPPSAPK